MSRSHTLLRCMVALLALLIGVHAAAEPGTTPDAPPRTTNTTPDLTRDTPDAQIERALAHAWTLYRTTIEEEGDVKPLYAGFDAVKQARALLKQHDGTLSAQQKRAFTLRADLLYEAFDRQLALSLDTLRGRFGLTAFLGRSLLVDPNAFGSHELVDEPETVAIQRLSEALRDEIDERWTIHPQHEILIVSHPRDPFIEQRAAYTLVPTHRFNTRTLDEVAPRLPAAQYQTLRDNPDAVPVADIARALQTPRLIVINVHLRDQIGALRHYSMDARLYAPDDVRKRDTIIVRASIRDRRPRLPWMLGGMFALLALAIGAFWWRTRERLVWSEALTLATLGYFAGLAGPHILWPFVSGLEPDGADPFLTTLWWPIVILGLVALGPPLLFSTLIRRISASAPLLRRSLEPEAPMGVALGAGSAAYLAPAAIIYAAPWRATVLVLGVTLGMIAGARLMLAVRARTLHAPWLVIPALVGLALVGLTFFGNAPLWCVAAGVLALLGTRTRQRATTTEPEDEAEHIVGLDDAAMRELVVRARNPVYQRAAPFSAGLDLLAPALRRRDPHVSWIYLEGPRGSGKTATASALVEELGERAVVLHGACAPVAAGDDGERAKPFEVFADVFEDTIMFGFEEHGEDVLAGIEGSVLDALPIVSMLLPEGDNAENALSDRGELYARVRRELVKQTRRGTRRVVLWLDNAQWLDPASQELLTHLAESFPTGAAHPIVFLVCARALPELPEICQHQLDAGHVTIAPDEDARHHLLRAAIGFDEDSARRLNDAVAEGDDAHNLAWLLTLVESVAREGKVTRDEQGRYTLTVRPGEPLPIPDSYKKLVGEAYDALEEDDRFLLHVAVCLGAIFQVEVLARVVERPRLEIITALDRIARQTGLIEDSWDTDDAFRFVSAQRFLALREHLGVLDLHPRLQQAQIIRDLHLKIARVLEELQEEQRADISDIAHHYYFAGRRDLKRALRFCRQAAQAARDVFAFDGYELQLQRAAICAELLAATTRDEQTRQEAAQARAELGQQLALLPYERSHVLAIPSIQQEMADEAIARLASWRENQQLADVPVELLIAMTRACYEGRRFEHSERMARELEAIGRVALKKARRTPQEALALVEGLHFIGLSLSPREQAPLRLDYLERARAAVEALEQESHTTLALQARVYNSLGEQLSQRATYDFEQAKRWFQRSITLKNMLRPADKPGLARAFGGLGRLHLYAETETPEAATENLRHARSYFEKDLRLCKEYGDVAGECQIMSHLGECAMKEEAFGEAIAWYSQSVKIASGLNAAFAALGLLEAHLASAEHDTTHTDTSADALHDAAQTALDVLNQGVPPFLEGRALASLSSERLDPARLHGWSWFTDRQPKPEPKPEPEPDATDASPDEASDEAPKKPRAKRSKPRRKKKRAGDTTDARAGEKRRRRRPRPAPEDEATTPGDPGSDTALPTPPALAEARTDTPTPAPERAQDTPADKTAQAGDDSSVTDAEVTTPDTTSDAAPDAASGESAEDASADTLGESDAAAEPAASAAPPEEDTTSDEADSAPDTDAERSA